jgi:CubicO group peptidase (beta-lactamase class C family)
VNTRQWHLLNLLLTAVAAAMISAPVAAALLTEPLAAVPPAVEEAIRAGETPGAVILIGHQDQVVLRQAFGHRSLAPPRPMAPDAIFDVASLTKVVATTPAVLQLVEKGRLQLDAPVARYWPEFKGHGKERITVRQLLTHYSGLRPGLLPKPVWSGYDAALKKIAENTPLHPTDSRFIYSDLNFTILGELVRRVSGEPLEVYCRRHIFEPLGMKDSGFKPSTSLHGRLAPTMEGSFGVVHDPDTRRMGGISGAAGLFSTADDLARFAQTILDAGHHAGNQLLSPIAIKDMALPQSPVGKLPARGWGWAISSPSGNWSEMLPAGTFGHKGFTGTLLWIDPETQTYLIVLSNRV